MVAEFVIIPQKNDKGILHIEFQNSEGLGAIRLVFDDEGLFKLKSGYRYSGITEYKPGEEYHIKVELDVETRFYEVTVNDDIKKERMFYAPVGTIDRIVFRTGEIRHFPNADTPTDQDFDVENGGEPDPTAVFQIKSLKTMKTR